NSKLMSRARRDSQSPPRLCGQRFDQLLEVFAIAQRGQVSIFGHVDSIAVTGGGGLAKEFHRPISVQLLLLGDLVAGDRQNAGEVVPLVGGPVRRLGQSLYFGD